MTKPIKLTAAASRKGKSHEKDGLPNQDAFGVYTVGKNLVLAVSDGLGSKRRSDAGSAAAVAAVREAVALSPNDVCPRDLCALISALWRVRVGDADNISNYGCTCLFAVLYSNRRVVVGMLGDGVVFFDIAGNEEILSGKSKEFANETSSLATDTNWRYAEFDATQKTVTLMLATDGVADDIDDDKIGAFVDSLYKNAVLGTKNIKKKNACIGWVLDHWTRPYSYDDKTLVLYKEK